MTPEELRKIAQKKREEATASSLTADKLRAIAEEKRKQSEASKVTLGQPTGEMTAVDPANPPRPVNFDREAGFLSAAGASIKMTPQGRAGFLEGTYGQGNVVTDKDGREFVWDAQAGEYYPVNKSGASWNDIAGGVGLAVEAAPAFAAGPTVGGAAAGAMAGNLGRQALSAALPGSDEMSFGDRANELAFSGAMGAAGQGVVNGVGKLIKGPKSFVAGKVQDAMSTPYAQESLQAADAMGLELPLGSITGNRSFQLLEKYLRNNVVTANPIAKIDVANLNKAVTHLNGVLDQHYGGAVGGEQVGVKIKEAFDTAVQATLDKREHDAVVDLARISASLPDPGLPIFSVNNFGRVLEDEILKGLRVGKLAGSETQAVTRELTKLRASVLNPDGTYSNMLTPEQMQALLSNYGQKAKGTGRLWKDISDAEQKRIAKRLFGALNDDLDEAAASADQLESGVGGALRQFRDNYRMNSEKLREIEQSTVGRMFGGTDFVPEKVAKRFASMEPSQVESSFKILEQGDPEVAGAVKKYIGTQILENSMKVRTAREALAKAGTKSQNLSDDVVTFDPDKFLEQIAKSPYKDIISPEEHARMALAVRGVEALAQKQMGVISQTQPLSLIGSLFDKILMPVNAAFAMIKQGYFPKKLMNFMFTKEGQEALMTFATEPGNAERVAGAMSYLAAAYAEEPDPENVRPSPELNSALKRKPTK